jgi:DNA polymerase-4
VVVLKLKLAERLGAGKFRLLTRRATLGEATDDGKTMSDAALALWERDRPRRAVRLVGVTASGIEAATGEQLALLPDGVRLRRAALNQALDAVVARFGRESVVRGGAQGEKGLTTRLKRGE